MLSVTEGLRGAVPAAAQAQLPVVEGRGVESEPQACSCKKHGLLSCQA